jgi:hypothetical protein
MVHEATPLEGRLEAHDVPVTGMVPWGYKFTLHLMSIAISHQSLLLAFRVLLMMRSSPESFLAISTTTSSGHLATAR